MAAPNSRLQFRLQESSNAAFAQTGLKQKEAMLARLRSSPDLPSLPPVALQVIDRASDPNCQTDELSRIVCQDPALCAKILRTVNSAMYGLRQPVGSIPAAVRFLGIHPLRSLVLTVSLASMRQTSLSAEMRQTYWRVSMAGALAARHLAVRGRRPAPDTDLVAGLVRDLGMLVLSQLFPTKYQTILSTSPIILSGFQCELEEEALQLNHAEASAELLRLWRLPEEIIEPVRHHHDWVRGTQLTGILRDRAQLLYFATQIGQLQLTVDRPMLVREVLTVAREHFSMLEPELRAFLEKLQAQMEEFASILQVDLGDVLDYSDVLNRGVEEVSRLTSKASPTPSSSHDASLGAHQDRTIPGGRRLDPAHPSEASQAGGDATVAGQGAQRVEGSSYDRTDLDELMNRLFQKPTRPGTLGVLDGYEIVEVIGCGGMGVVFRAVDTRLQRTVAIKTLRPHLASNQAAISGFMHEGRAVASLTHENIVRVYAVGETTGLPYLVMEHVPGITLRDRLQREAPLPLAEIIRVGLQTASGLSLAHANGLVHHDIKPGNLLLEESSGRVKIVDFGLVQVADRDHPSLRGRVAGTPHYMSPEQIDGKTVDQRSDMFSLGCVLYTASTGRLPFDANTTREILQATLECELPPVRNLNASLPVWLEEILAGLLTKDPARRYPSAADMRRVFLGRWAQLLITRQTAKS
jgi:HD-like signal output (HDOD) protein